MGKMIDKAVGMKYMNDLTDKEINSSLSIMFTDYNRNRRYSERVRNQWRSLYTMSGMSVYEIAKMYGAGYNTVRCVVDSEYYDHLSDMRVEYNQKYREGHPKKYDPTYFKGLVERKRKIVTDLAHLAVL